MTKTINTTKTKYVRIDGWRGYSMPINAVGAANDTGTWSDSPCPSHIAEKEINEFKALLRAEKIKYRGTAGNTSNVFCGKHYVCVHEDDRARALEIATKHRDNTTLFYPTT